MNRLLLALLPLAVLAFPAHAEDRIVLRDGRDVVGVVESREGGTLKVRTGETIVTLFAADVLHVERLPEPEEQDGSDTDEPEPSPPPVPSRRAEKRVADVPAVRLRLEDGAEVRGPSRAEPPAPEAAPPLAEDDPRAPAVKALVERLGAEDREQRVQAAAAIVELWPASGFALDYALAFGSEQARIEAVYLLRDPRLGDQTPRLRRALADESGRVTIAALRTIRNLEACALEPDVLRLLDSDAAWSVRQDAARTLERIGGARSFPVVVALWSAEPDEHRRRRLKRVMREIVRADLGEDPKVWQRAVGEVFMGRRTLREPSGR